MGETSSQEKLKAREWLKNGHAITLFSSSQIFYREATLQGGEEKAGTCSLQLIAHYVIKVLFLKSNFDQGTYLFKIIQRLTISME